MRDYSDIGKIIIEQLLYEVNAETGPCFYPGKFKPPHKGHFEAAKYLASQTYINKVYVVISKVTKFGISPEDSLRIWNEYLEAEPNPKIDVKISTESTPIKDIFRFASQNPELKSIYVAAAQEESEELGYFDKLKEKFPGIIKPITIPNQFDRISATQMRQAVKDGDFDAFSKFLPDSSYNKGVTKDVFGLLTKIIK
jgi:FAD synthase